jgi:hypothetical protein
MPLSRLFTVWNVFRRYSAELGSSIVWVQPLLLFVLRLHDAFPTTNVKSFAHAHHQHTSSTSACMPCRTQHGKRIFIDPKKILFYGSKAFDISPIPPNSRLYSQQILLLHHQGGRLWYSVWSCCFLCPTLWW